MKLYTRVLPADEYTEVPWFVIIDLSPEFLEMIKKLTDLVVLGQLTCATKFWPAYWEGSDINYDDAKGRFHLGLTELHVYPKGFFEFECFHSNDSGRFFSSGWTLEMLKSNGPNPPSAVTQVTLVNGEQVWIDNELYEEVDDILKRINDDLVKVDGPL